MERFRANVYLDREVRDRAKELADRMGLSFSAFVNIALYEYLKQSAVIQLSEVLSGVLRGVLDRESTRE